MSSRNLLGPPAVTGNERGSGAREWSDPLEILHAQACRTCPELLLISHDMFEEGRNQAIFWILPRLQRVVGLWLFPFCGSVGPDFVDRCRRCRWCPGLRP